MEELNSIEARKLNPVERMSKLQRAILKADGRVKVHATRRANGSLLLAAITLGPITSYMLYQFFHPRGFHQSFHGDYGAPYGILMRSMERGVTLMKLYNREEYDRQLLAKFNTVSYHPEGVTLHPISKAFTEAKEAGQEEVKNYIPYNWI
ncbi:unnamed protein product [Moneuplotes crassus]|uniref:Uncharacterized protein n=1 Tax=Euplotes crassus TaxID=5936 RepID=A0AAD1Y2H4_EUPCR|nr:unnamed protein product [Moneuplotes crassus]